MNKKKMILLPLVSLGLVLASCGDQPGNSTSSNQSSGGGENSSQTSGGGAYDPGEVVLPEAPTGNLANGP